MSVGRRLVLAERHSAFGKARASGIEPGRSGASDRRGRAPLSSHPTHPHVHCVMAAGGLAPDHSRWISSRRSFFLPVKVLSRVFCGKFVAGLKTAFQAGALQFHGHLLPLVEPRAFASWLRVLFRHDWVVYSKRPFGGPEHVLKILPIRHWTRLVVLCPWCISMANGTV